MTHFPTFERLESEVRSYCRSFPVVFDRAHGATLVAEDGRQFIDFFAGAGALNYGHNPPDMQKRLVEYLTSGRVTHSLDLHTTAKRDFLERFEEVVLQPRKLEYKLMFPGPTGTNAVESALKLARKVTGRHTVVSFTNGFHGMTLGSLAVTGSQGKRAGAGIPLTHTRVMPFDGYLGDDVDTVDVIEQMLVDPSSGVDLPAAFVLETVQAEGGVHPSSFAWQRKLAALAKRHGILLIVDDIQVGVGRTGPYFSFEPAGIVPDLITLSKSLSGYGLPLATVLIRPDLDQWKPGEHNGTFRGHMPAFVTATAALDRWTDDTMTRKVRDDAALVERRLADMAETLGGSYRGRGLIQGLVTDSGETADAISAAAFERGLIIETCGPRGEVVKVLPPLVIERDQLSAGLDTLEDAVQEVALRGLTPAAAADDATTNGVHA